ncbi:hypothetical protein [Anaeromyxobacter oryzae]|uniref:Secreted protein n=1 Tax=Anaeromyxobacter oryzae TaxID=2918170 RepID=A0ABM7WTS4_9BACT|nr:hypothetical protein [Anaeromyxobacter oryzae]BDG02892.1 hypothetical protein AMOR_18880 [Anaeromyxobacter oryzae]
MPIRASAKANIMACSFSLLLRVFLLLCFARYLVPMHRKRWASRAGQGAPHGSGLVSQSYEERAVWRTVERAGSAEEDRNGC